MARNAVVTATAAMISGTTARNEAKTKLRTASAPRAPMTISPSTPGPLAEPPAVVSGPIPVTCTWVPAGR